jgi:hypothetical protein
MPAPAITTLAHSIVQTFIAEADARPPHCALDRLLAVGHRMELEQGGRLTDFQVRTLAAWLLGAQKLPADAAGEDLAIVPEWLSDDDATRYAADVASVRPGARMSSSLSSH